MPPPAPNSSAMASALRRGSSRNSCAASAPAVAKDIAPKNPASTRHSVCHHSAGSCPVAVSATAVVTMPKANSRAGPARRISTMVSSAPPI